MTEGDLDATIGIVHVKDAFDVDRAHRDRVSVRSLARPVPVIPDSLDGDGVLKAVRSAGSQVVLIADEYGGTAGIVTIEDVVEEILGEVYDEHDDADAEREVLRIGASWEVSGLVRIDDLPEKVGYFAPEGSYETLGGLIMACLGRIPISGDRLVLPETTRDFFDEFESGISGRWVALVTSMDDRRVDRVLLTPMTDAEAKEYLGNG